MYNKSVNFKELVLSKIGAQKMLPALISAAIMLGAVKCSSDVAKNDPSEIEVTPIDVPVDEGDQIPSKFFPLKIQYKDGLSGDVLVRNDLQSFDYNYLNSERLPLITWSPVDTVREIKEYQYSINGYAWQSNGKNTELQITEPLGLGYGYFYLKTVFPDGSESYTYELKFNLVEAYTSGLQFKGPYNENFQKILKTSDGGYLAVGVQQFRAAQSDGLLNNGLLLNKYDSNYALVWTKTYSGNKGGWDIINYSGNNKERAEEQIIETEDSYFVLMSSQSSDGVFNVNNGSSDISLLRISKTDGEVVFCKTFGTANYDRSWKLMKISDQEFLVLWTARNTKNETICFSKINAQGEIIFEKILSETTEFYFNTILTADGVVIFHKNRIPGSSYEDIKIKKYGFNAELLQDIKLKAASSLSGAQRLKNGNFIVYGLQGNNSWLMELDQNFNIVADKVYESGSGDCDPGSLLELNNGNIIISRRAQRDAQGNTWVAELDANREILWSKYLGEPDFHGWVGIPAAITINYNDIVVFNSVVSGKLLLSRVESGNVLWSKALDLPYGTQVNSLTKDYDDNILISGEVLGNFGKNALILKINKDTGDIMN